MKNISKSLVTIMAISVLSSNVMASAASDASILADIEFKKEKFLKTIDRESDNISGQMLTCNATIETFGGRVIGEQSNIDAYVSFDFLKLNGSTFKYRTAFWSSVKYNNPIDRTESATVSDIDSVKDIEITYNTVLDNINVSISMNKCKVK